MTLVPRHDVFERAGAVARARAHTGRMSCLAGMAAEGSVAAEYVSRGYDLLESRWRGKRGEIDLIFADGEGVVLVEVKKSRDVATAMSRITPAQMRRLFAAAEEYVGTQPKGALTDMRFDVALVDGHGQVSVVENAFCGWI